jgi:hypothetical protein
LASVFRSSLIPVVLFGAFLTLACGPESRTAGRQRRLDTFRSVLPTEVLQSFDAIESEEDCEIVARGLTDAVTQDRELEMAIDSIMKAELIETFTDEEIIFFFWYYFAYAIETGTVPEP